MIYLHRLAKLFIYTLADSMVLTRPIRRRLTSVVALATLCIVSLFASVVSADLLQDGGFESASIGNYTSSIGDGWSVSTGTISIVQNEYSAVPHGGLNFAYLDYAFTVNTMSQTFATTPGQSYMLTYYVADTVGSNDLLTVTFGGTTVYNGIAPNGGVSSPSDYVLQSATINATAATTTVSFAGQYEEAFAGDGTILDDVSVTTVPEPSTLTLLALGAVVLVARRRS